MGLDLSSSAPAPLANNEVEKKNTVQDVLSLFDSVQPPAAPPSAVVASSVSPVPGLANDSLLNLGNNSFNLDGFLSSPTAPPAAVAGNEESKHATAEMIALNKNGLRIAFTFDKSSGSSDHSVTINMKASNNLPFPMTDFLFQAAVPKVRNATHVDQIPDSFLSLIDNRNSLSHCN